MKGSKLAIIACALAAVVGFTPRVECAQTLTYTYDAIGRLTSVTYDGTLTTVYLYDPNGNIVVIATGVTPVDVEDVDALPSLPVAYALRASHPNPLRTTGVVPYELPRDSRVRLEIFDVAGRRVRTLIDETQVAGYYRAVWDGRDEAGRAVASGVYYTRLAAGGFVGTDRIAVTR